MTAWRDLDDDELLVRLQRHDVAPMHARRLVAQRDAEHTAAHIERYLGEA